MQASDFLTCNKGPILMAQIAFLLYTENKACKVIIRYDGWHHSQFFLFKDT